jgi:hypothetical protein
MPCRSCEVRTNALGLIHSYQSGELDRLDQSERQFLYAQRGRTRPEFAAQRARIAAATPSRRLFTPPAEIASAIVFTLFDAARGM